MPPVEFEINAKRSASLSSDVATKPATTSLCPPKYFCCRMQDNIDA